MEREAEQWVEVRLVLTRESEERRCLLLCPSIGTDFRFALGTGHLLRQAYESWQWVCFEMSPLERQMDHPAHATQSVQDWIACCTCSKRRGREPDHIGVAESGKILRTEVRHELLLNMR